MRYSKLQRKINIRKILLNKLLNHLKPTNKLMIYLSQNLDKLIVEAQQIKLQNNIRKNIEKPLKSQIA